MVLLSIQGLLRTLVIIVGVIVLMRFIGRLMMAKRSMQEHKNMQDRMRKEEEILNETKKNYGKTSISTKKSTNLDDGDFTPYEEVK